MGSSGDNVAKYVTSANEYNNIVHKRVVFVKSLSAQIGRDRHLNKSLTTNFLQNRLLSYQRRLNHTVNGVAIDMMRFSCKTDRFALSSQFCFQCVPLVLAKKTSTYTLCF